MPLLPSARRNEILNRLKEKLKANQERIGAWWKTKTASLRLSLSAAETLEVYEKLVRLAALALGLEMEEMEGKK